MSFIDYTYFINDISVPATTFGSDSFASVINRYEPEILKQLLGYDLYKALIDDLDGNYVPQSARFLALVNGADFSFTYGAYTISTRWNGFKNAEKISLIAYYVYYSQKNQNENFNSGAGIANPKLENADKINPVPKLVDIYNKCDELYGDIPNSLLRGRYYNKDYPYFTTVNNPIWINPKEYFLDINNYEHYNILPSAYNFLLANIANYPEWVFEPLDKQNIMGI